MLDLARLDPEAHLVMSTGRHAVRHAKREAATVRLGSVKDERFDRVVIREDAVAEEVCFAPLADQPRQATAVQARDRGDSGVVATHCVIPKLDRRILLSVAAAERPGHNRSAGVAAERKDGRVLVADLPLCDVAIVQPFNGADLGFDQLEETRGDVPRKSVLRSQRHRVGGIFS